MYQATEVIIQGLDGVKVHQIVLSENAEAICLYEMQGFGYEGKSKINIYLKGVRHKGRV